MGRLEDWDGSLEFTMYPRAYEAYGYLLESDMPLKAYGRIDLRDAAEPKIVVDKFEQWHTGASSEARKSGDKAVYVNLTDQSLCKAVLAVLDLYPGDAPVRAQLTEGGRPVLKLLRRRVEICDDLLIRLRSVVGDKGVIVK